MRTEPKNINAEPELELYFKQFWFIPLILNFNLFADKSLFSV